jgi:hypothetical protein
MHQLNRAIFIIPFNFINVLKYYSATGKDEILNLAPPIGTSVKIVLPGSSVFTGL